MWSIMVEEVGVVQVAVVTICVKPSLSSMELRMGRWGWLDVGERSMLKSPRSTRDLSLDGDNCSRADSTSDSREASTEGGRYRRPHTTLEFRRGSSTMRSSVLLWDRRMSTCRWSLTYRAMPPPCHAMSVSIPADNLVAWDHCFTI